MDTGIAVADLEKLWASLGSLPDPVSRPALVVVSGLPGTGKSHFCRRLAERFPCVVLETDALRKVLVPAPTYSAGESQRLFGLTHQLIGELLRRGIRVVLDATNLQEHHREYLYHIAERQEAKLVIVRLEAPAEVVQQRLERRNHRLEPREHSAATWVVYQRMRGSVERIRRSHFRVDSSQDIEPALAKVARQVLRPR